MLYKMLRRSVYAAALLLLLRPAGTRAQAALQTDTLHLDLRQAEAAFLSNNLRLLARHYNVEADKALIQQAKRWDNPVLITDQNIYSNNRFFEHGRDAAGNPAGQYFFQVQQLIQTAGKRGHQISMARTNAEISQWQFNDVLRSLKQQLRVDFYTVHQLLLARALYAQQESRLEQLLAGMKAQLDAGNIARKDYLRLQALELSLQQDVLDNVRKLNDAQAELRILLQVTDGTFIYPEVEDGIPPAPAADIESMISAARENNATYRLQQLQLQYQSGNLAYQKSLAVPDVTLGPEYDHNSNYAPHYVGLGISLPLPVLNRNQGNIRSAAFQVKQQEAELQSAGTVLRNNVISAYQKLLATRQLLAGKQESFYADYARLYDHVVESYRRRQLSLVEFIDYFQAYRDIREKQLQLELDLRQAREELNFQVGQDVR